MLGYYSYYLITSLQTQEAAIKAMFLGRRKERGEKKRHTPIFWNRTVCNSAAISHVDLSEGTFCSRIRRERARKILETRR